MIADRSDAALVAVLERAQQRGWVGKNPVTAQIAHPRAYLAAIAPDTRTAADVGSGGGLPGLVLAAALPACDWTLIEASRARCDHLLAAVDELELGHRVRVEHGRAEDLARSPQWRDGFELVTARSFGSPSVTAESAAGLVQPGGRLVVSDPPGSADHRWPPEGLAALGLADRGAVAEGDAHVRLLDKVAATPSGVPRTNAAIRSRPRW